jgi:manganese transport system ATP-binding protein
MTSTTSITAEPPVERRAPAIELRGVLARRGGRPVLAVDRLDVPAGRVCAVVGPNGSGKSTLLHVIAGVLPGVDGDVRVLGQPPGEVRRRVAYVLQATAVGEHLPVTVREVVAMGRYAWGRRSDRRADRAAVDAAIERLELGDLVRRHVGELSGGQRQRVLVAQGLAQQGELLLLDEPVSGLDTPSAARIRSVVSDERAAGHTAVVATHDLVEAAAADWVVLLAGRLVAAGPPALVLSRGHLTEAYGDRLLRVADELVVVDDGAHHHGEVR